MPSSDVITTIWDDPRNVDTLVKLYTEGKSFAQIAAAIPGATRNACISKVHRMKLPPRADRYAQSRHTSSRARTVNGEVPRKGNSGAPGQAKGNVILHRIDGRLKAERSRQEGKHSHRGQEPFRVDVDDDGGVDVSHLCGIMDLGASAIPSRCRWVHGEPSANALFCGKPTKAGSSWCPEHHARVYSGRAPL